MPRFRANPDIRRLRDVAHGRATASSSDVFRDFLLRRRQVCQVRRGQLRLRCMGAPAGLPLSPAPHWSARSASGRCRSCAPSVHRCRRVDATPAAREGLLGRSSDRDAALPSFRPGTGVIPRPRAPIRRIPAGAAGRAEMNVSMTKATARTGHLHGACSRPTLVVQCRVARWRSRRAFPALSVPPPANRIRRSSARLGFASGALRVSWTVAGRGTARALVSAGAPCEGSLLVAVRSGHGRQCTGAQPFTSLAGRSSRGARTTRCRS